MSKFEKIKNYLDTLITGKLKVKIRVEKTITTRKIKSRNRDFFEMVIIFL